MYVGRVERQPLAAQQSAQRHVTAALEQVLYVSIDMYV